MKGLVLLALLTATTVTGQSQSFDIIIRAIEVIVGTHDPANHGNAAVAVNVDGAPAVRGSLPRAVVSITTR